MDIDDDEVTVYIDTKEEYSVGFDYKGKVAAGIDLGFTNGVELAFAMSWQDLGFPTDGWEEFDTLEETKERLIGFCEFCDEED